MLLICKMGITNQSPAWERLCGQECSEEGKHLTRYVAGVQQVVTRVTPQDQKQVALGESRGGESHPLPSEDKE